MVTLDGGLIEVDGRMVGGGLGGGSCSIRTDGFAAAEGLHAIPKTEAEQQQQQKQQQMQQQQLQQLQQTIKQLQHSIGEHKRRRVSADTPRVTRV